MVWRSGRFAVVAGVVVGQRDRVDAGAGQRGEDDRRGGEGVAALQWRTVVGQRALEVADRQVGGLEVRCQRAQPGRGATRLTAPRPGPA